MVTLSPIEQGYAKILIHPSVRARLQLANRVLQHLADNSCLSQASTDIRGLIKELDSQVSPTISLLEALLSEGALSSSLMLNKQSIQTQTKTQLQLLHQHKLDVSHALFINLTTGSIEHVSDDEIIQSFELLKRAGFDKQALAPLLAKVTQRAYQPPAKIPAAATGLLRKVTDSSANFADYRSMIGNGFAMISKQKTMLLSFIVLGLTLLFTPWFSPLMKLLPMWVQVVSSVTMLALLFRPILTKTVGTIKDRVQELYHFKTYQLAAEADLLAHKQQAFMHSLQAGIMDTNRYPIEQCSQTYNALLQAQRQLLKRIEATSPPTPPHLQALHQQSKSAVSKLLQPIQQQMAAFSKHLVQRLADDMPQVISDARQGIQIKLSCKQLDLYRQWLLSHGSKADNHQFERATSFILPFEQQLQTATLSCPNQYHCTPWGKRKANTAELKGWRTLFELANQQQGIDIVDVMLGHTSKPVHEFARLFDKFSAPQQAIQQVQHYLYNCLDMLPLDSVFLLSSSDQTKILQWELANTDLIKAAQSLIQDFISHPCNPKDSHNLLSNLPKLISTLEGAKWAAHLQSKPFVLFNDLRDFVKSTDGSNPLVFYALRFMPKDTQTKYARLIANKRLYWWSAHPDKIDIGLEDQQLLHRPDITGKWLKANIKSLPYNHPLREKLGEHGLITTQLPAARRHCYARP